MIAVPKMDHVTTQLAAILNHATSSLWAMELHVPISTNVNIKHMIIPPVLSVLIQLSAIPGMKS